jgi:aspartate/methionine/tyrosine aminotransferase
MRAAVWAAADATVGRLPGARSVRGTGALYAFVRLPPGVSDDEAVRILADEHGVLVLPGASAGMPGHLRVSFASVQPATAAADGALAALRRGLEDIAARAEAAAPSEAAAPPGTLGC